MRSVSWISERLLCKYRLTIITSGSRRAGGIVRVCRNVDDLFAVVKRLAASGDIGYNELVETMEVLADFFGFESGREKCGFPGLPEGSYLSFWFTPDGVKPYQADLLFSARVRTGSSEGSWAAAAEVFVGETLPLEGHAVGSSHTLLR